MQDKVEVMIKKFNLWLNCTENNKTETFLSLHDFLCTIELCLTDSVKRDIIAYLSDPAAQLRRYVPETDSLGSWLHHPFTAVPASHYLSAYRQEGSKWLVVRCLKGYVAVKGSPVPALRPLTSRLLSAA